jgi:hypothetical protein
MANFEATTRLRDTKDTARTPVMVAFAVMVRWLGAVAQAERMYLEGIGPMSDGRSRSPELQLDDLRNALSASCRDILCHAAQTSADRGLLRLAFFLNTIFELTDHSDRGHALGRLRLRGDLFGIEPWQPEMGTALKLQARFFDLLEDLSVLPDFGGDTAAVTEAHGPELAPA